MAFKKSTHLTNVADILDALGGYRNVAELTGAGYTAVCNWRAEERIPARFYRVMYRALRKRKRSADHTLWGQEEAAA